LFECYIKSPLAKIVNIHGQNFKISTFSGYLCAELKAEFQVILGFFFAAVGLKKWQIS
jgi:hypothetical protein